MKSLLLLVSVYFEGLVNITESASFFLFTFFAFEHPGKEEGTCFFLLLRSHQNPWVDTSKLQLVMFQFNVNSGFKTTDSPCGIMKSQGKCFSPQLSAKISF